MKEKIDYETLYKIIGGPIHNDFVGRFGNHPDIDKIKRVYNSQKKCYQTHVYIKKNSPIVSRWKAMYGKFIVIKNR